MFSTYDKFKHLTEVSSLLVLKDSCDGCEELNKFFSSFFKEVMVLNMNKAKRNSKMIQNSNYDLVIVYIDFINKSKLSIIDSLKKQYANKRLIIISSHKNKEHTQLKKYPFYHHITKPFYIYTLIDTLINFLEFKHENRNA